MLRFGKAEGISNPGYVCVENLTSEEQAYTIDSYSVNGFTLNSGAGRILPPRCKQYSFISFGNNDMKNNNISTIETLQVKVSTYENKEQYYDKVSNKSKWIEVKLNLNFSADDIIKEDIGETIFNKNNVKIIINKYGFYYDTPRWYLTIENESDNDITIRFGDEDNVSSSYVNDGLIQVGAHNKKNTELSAFTHKEVPDEILTKVYVMDYSGTQILYTGDEMIKLYPTKKISPNSEIVAEWSSGEEKVLDIREGVTLLIKKLDWYGQLCYALELKNDTNDNVSYEVRDIVINNDIILDDVETMYANPNERRVGIKLPYYTSATDFGIIDEIHSITFTIKETSSFVLPSALNDHVFKINISDEAIIKNFKEIYKPLDIKNTYLEAKASSQSVLNNDKLQIELLGFGGVYHPAINVEGYSASEYTTGNYGLCITNISSDYQKVTIEGVSVNGAYIPKTKSIKIPPNCKAYISDYIGDYDLLEYNITSIEEISFALFTQNDDEAGYAEIEWVPIKLDTFGKNNVVFETDLSTIFNQNGVKVILDSYEIDKWNSSIYTLMFINTRDENISLSVTNMDGSPVKSSVSQVKLGPKQYRKVKIEFYGKIIDEFDVNIVVKDISETNIISKSDALININNKAYISKGE